MKIKNVSCTQFAGIRDRNVTFSDGINVLYGKNESGKSTMANLLARTLFQKAKLDRRSDRDFCDLYFPGARRNGGAVGDFADGTVLFETEQGTYKLSKEWGADARCTLFTPTGDTLHDPKKIDEILKETLVYGEGVYADLLLSSQRNTDTALQTLLDASKKTQAKAEITDIVSQAFAESDGISIDAVEQAIHAKIDELAGKHWDIERGAPVRKAGRWSNGLGEILKSYYELEDANEVLRKINHLENEADRAAKDYTEKDAATNAAEEAFRRFNTLASQLIEQRANQRELSHNQDELKKLQGILDQWPALERKLAQATSLRDEQASRVLLDQYGAAKKIVDQIGQLKDEIAGKLCPTDSEIEQVKSEQRRINDLENKLCGMNLTAAVHMLGGNTVQIVSVRTGQHVDISDGIASIGEAVRIAVPGVMQMELSPADVDIAAVEEQLNESRRRTAGIFEKYQLDTIEALENLANEIDKSKEELERANRELAFVLKTTTYEALEAEAANVSADLRTKAEIEAEIEKLCGSGGLSEFITEKRTIIEGYISEHGSVDQLEEKCYDLSMELGRLQKSVTQLQNVPAEYANICDPKEHLQMLQDDLKEKRGLRDTALKKRSEALSELESYQKNISGDPNAGVEEAERALSEKKALLDHWLQIQQVFYAQKEKLNTNPMQDIAQSFSRYLGLISGGRVSSEFPEADKLVMQVYSNERLLDYNKLSEGTKETVSLAFRLAVLDHLFPNGGLIVLDDPFTDMDAERAAAGCVLLKECAKRHQVIFLTCREEYLDMLQGNVIRI